MPTSVTRLVTDSLEALGITHPRKVMRNDSTPVLCEEAIKRGEVQVAHRGPLVIHTGKHTGRSVQDRFIVDEPASHSHVNWGKSNKPISEQAFNTLLARMTAYFQHKELFVQDAFAGADPDLAVPLRVVTESALHASFARTMFVRPDGHDFAEHHPEILILHAPNFHAVPHLDHTRTDTFIVLHLTRKIMLIGGTAYAGEIKKAVFSLMNYLMPLRGVMPMHCSANIGPAGDVAVFFGLSGTGKTTLSANPDRQLIGDDEHGWSDSGVFNFEGGCYAKIIKLGPHAEPEIFARTEAFGTIIENAVVDPVSRRLKLDDASITENTRAAYPLALISYAAHPSLGGHASNVIFLTCDAFGVLPPIARLTPEQAMYHFISGYSAKVAGTEAGMGKDPEATFSACFGAPFMVHRPSVYAKMLGEKIRAHQSKCWLVNTGWTGGPYGIGRRMSIKVSRAALRAALDGSLNSVEYTLDPVFGVEVPQTCPGVPQDALQPRQTWADPAAYDQKAHELAARFVKNFADVAPDAGDEIRRAGPKA